VQGLTEAEAQEKIAEIQAVNAQLGYAVKQTAIEQTNSPPAGNNSQSSGSSVGNP